MSARPPAAGKGRPKGATNKATREIKEIAQAYTAEAVETLATIMRSAKCAAAARVAAANALLDRGYGKPAQTIDATHTIIRDPAELADAELADIASRGRRGNAASEASAPEPSKLH